MKNNNKGFTLLEIILVVAIIAILAGIVIFAINPSKQLGDTRNAQRRVDVNTILSAIYQYSIDNNGSFPSAVPTGTATVLGTAGSGCNTTCGATTTAAACADLSGDLIPDFVVDIPLDPSSGTAANTDYYMLEDADGRLIVGACDPDRSATIEITR